MAYKKGHKHSEETKLKISLALKGIKRDDEFKKKISIATKKAMNRKDVKDKMKKVYDMIRDNDEFKEKISIGTKKGMAKKEVKEKLRKAKLGKVGPRLGIPHTEETKLKLSKSCKGINLGPDNPNWKGGVSAEPYCTIWLDNEYKESIKERDNYKCQNPYCWKTSVRLVIHHIDHIKKNCHPNNLITLCNSCNIRCENKKHYRYYNRLYRRIIRNNNHTEKK